MNYLKAIRFSALICLALLIGSPGIHSLIEQDRLFWPMMPQIGSAPQWMGEAIRKLSEGSVWDPGSRIRYTRRLDSVDYNRITMNNYANPAIVQTEAGPVKGKVAKNYRIFQGIPYAAPPSGELRWRAPQAVRPWSKVRDATQPGNLCPQQASAYTDVTSENEDCLCLNITTPLSLPDKPKPVMVWIHGDGAVGGGSLFDARRLAIQGNVVVVTINYRLGIFGAFGYPSLEGSGTFGLQDQQAALRWVQRNIAAFGGDLNNVTIFGQSYGALSVVAQLLSPRAEGLFHRAIIQSGFALMDMPAASVFPGVEALPWFGWRAQAEVEELGRLAAVQLGCTDSATALDCLRKLPVKALFAQAHLFQPYAYGNKLLPDLPAEALKKGQFHRVPVLCGNTRDEHRTFVGLFRELAGQPVTKEAYPVLLDSAFGNRARQIADRYPLSDYESPSIAWASVLTDRMWALATWEQLQLFSRYIPTYAYEFADRQAPSYLPFPPDFPPGAFHAAELSYLFRDPEANAQLSPQQRQLSNAMIQSWTNFARQGNPSAASVPPWPAFRPADAIPYVQSLAPGKNGIHPVDYTAEHRLNFWLKRN